MMRTILVVAAALVSVSVGPRHTNASEAPWCAVLIWGRARIGTANIARSKLLPQRQYFLAGNRGFCNASPYYVAGYAKQTGRRRARPH